MRTLTKEELLKKFTTRFPLKMICTEINKDTIVIQILSKQTEPEVEDE